MRNDFRRFIISSNLSIDQKELWLKFINTCSDKVINDTYDLIKNDTELLFFLSQNLEAKALASATNDSEAWDKIAVLEKKYFETRH